MKWTFGIVTAGNEVRRLNLVIASIIREFSPDRQIIVVGGLKEDLLFKSVEHIPFDESVKPGWITRKKNLIVQSARYDNICFLHDYVELVKGWYSDFFVFGEDWLTCTNCIENMNGERFRDWCELYHDSWMNPTIDGQVPPVGDGKLVDYNERCSERWQYYSGAYFCAKRSVMEAVPLDENRVWGQGEDVQWSRLIYQKYGPRVFQFNPHAVVRFLKQKQHAPWENK